jgi:hypothetical protein
VSPPNIYGIIAFVVLLIATVIWFLLRAPAKPPPFHLDHETGRMWEYEPMPIKVFGYGDWGFMSSVRRCTRCKAFGRPVITIDKKYKGTDCRNCGIVWDDLESK